MLRKRVAVCYCCFLLPQPMHSYSLPAGHRRVTDTAKSLKCYKVEYAKNPPLAGREAVFFTSVFQGSFTT